MAPHETPWWERPQSERGHRCGDHKGRKGDLHRNRAGDPCGARLGKHAIACPFHGGAAGQVKAKEQQRAAQDAAMQMAQRMLQEVGQDKDPIVHLLECLYLSAALVKVWGRMVSDLDHAGETTLSGGGGDVELMGKQRGWAIRNFKNIGTDEKPVWRSELDHDPLLVPTRDGVKMHPFVEQYHDWVDRKVKYAKACVDAGVQKRMVDLATAQSSVWVEAFVAVIDSPALQLAPAARMEARRLLADKLRELEAAA